MKPGKMRRLISILLTLCMLMSLLPATAVAETDPAATAAEQPGEQRITYSDVSLAFDQTEARIGEAEGEKMVTLRRGGNIGQALETTVLVYDNNANYGVDYQICYQGALISGIDGARSIYDAFRDGGALNEGWQLTAAAGVQQTGDSSEAAEDINAAQMLAQLDELNVLAARIPVTFAAGESTVTLTVEVLDDTLSEYEESFLLAALDGEGNLAEGAQLLMAIADNEAAPMVTVGFNCARELVTDNATGLAALTFSRYGDLATSTEAVLLVGGEALGYVDFAPYQETQIVYVEPGTYTLAAGSGYSVAEESVRVVSTDGSVTVPDGGDAELDAVPDAYASMETLATKAWTIPSWFPAWARNTGTVETTDYISYMGSSNNNLFVHNSISGVGTHTFLNGGGNEHLLDTSGTFSRMKSGYVNIRTSSRYDMTGIESIETTGYVSGLDYSNKVTIILHTGGAEVGRNSQKNSRDNVAVTTVYTLPKNYQRNCYVQVENTDPSSTDDGCALYVPNGFKANKRTYHFVMETPQSLYFRGVGNVNINTQNASTSALTKMGPDARVSIAYQVVGDLPVKLVGYKVKNLSTGATSETIALSNSYFIFNREFLKSYESTYCADAMYNGTSYPTFGIVPVFEKIPVEVHLEKSTLGTISVKDWDESTQLYMGEKIVVEGQPAANATFYGVYFKYFENLSSDAVLSGKLDASSSGAVTLEIGKYNEIYLQGSFSTVENQLVVSYAEADETRRHGTLGFKEGVVVDKDSYVLNDFFPLVASPEEGYITRWDSDGRLFYGNTFYYQLDNNPNHNSIRVEFVRASALKTKTATISGTISVSDTDLRTHGDVPVPLAGERYSVISDRTYSGTTGADGTYSMENFTGVVGGTYSIMVMYRGMVGYKTFQPFPDENTTQTVNLTMPQFASGSIYPSEVNISLGTTSSSHNVVQVRPTDTGEIHIRVTNQIGGSIKAVKVHFLSIRDADPGNELLVIKAAYNEKLTGENDAGAYSYWTVDVTDSSILPVQSQMYISIIAEKEFMTAEVTTDDTGNVLTSTTVTTTGVVETGLVNSGYIFISAINDTTIPVAQSIPDIPGAQNAYSVDTSALSIPLLGNADFSITSVSGGYFVQKVVNGTTYLICGYSITPVYGLGTLQNKYDGAAKTQTALSALRNQSAQQKAGDADIVNILLGSGNSGGAGTAKEQTAKKTPSNWSLYPAFMFKFALTPGVDAEGNNKNYITGFEMALGFDANYLQNIPFSIYGVPFYLCFTTQIEALVQGQFAIDPGAAEPGADLTMSLYDLCRDPDTKGAVSGQSFIAVPKLSLGLKAGAGYNAFLGVYVNGTVSMPLIFQCDPYFDAAGNFNFSISAGADLVFFTANQKIVNVGNKFGSQELYNDLSTIQGFASSARQIIAAAADGTQIMGADDTAPTLEEMLNGMTFSLMERPAEGTTARRSGNLDSATLAENVFKNTAVQLVQLGNGSVMALFLKDNGENGYNYLSAAYAISADNGVTWSNLSYVNSNIGQASTALQFDINVFQLEDRTLVTWSEADFDTLLQDVDVNNLTVPQIARVMNAMNLRGRFFDSATGKPLGAAFTIAAHSTVACGALDAVQNGDEVFVYYQRNAFPTAEGTEVTDLVATDRTIALARANTAKPDEWISTPVRALNENGQQYRITEVEPFVHDGVMGEILVIDRNGKLAVYDESEVNWIADNEDRQLYLRTYGFDADGTPQPTALIPLTNAADCAQSPQVVSNEKYLHLFWNENGKVVYLTDFIATAQDHLDVQTGAILLKNSDGTISTVSGETVRGSDITGSETLTIGTTFSVSMAKDGNVLLSWIGNDTSEDALVPTDEIFGVILHTVTNAEAVAQTDSNSVDDTGNDHVYQLWAEGKPIALTDENSLIGALDSICMESGKDSRFLLAFTRLNATTRTEVTSADLLAVQSVDAPSLVVDEISAPSYPMPGSTMTVEVSVTNYGLEPLHGARFIASGIGKSVTVDYDRIILPGESAMVELAVAVPESFSKTTELKVTACGLAGQADYSASDAVTVCYGAYFAIDEMSELISIPNSKSCEAITRVKNVGNAVGSPVLTFTNTIYGSDEYHREYVFQSDATVAPNETAALTYVLEDTLINRERTANLVVATGDNADQRADSLMPLPALSTEEMETSAETAFTDVADHWAKEAIAFVYAQGLMNGMSQTTFEPETSATRAMLVTVLYRMAGKPESSGAMPFTDVGEDWYTDAISWAAEKELVKGYGDDTFGPDDPVTREQMAVIFCRYAAFAGYDTGKRAELTAFRDYGLVSDYAVESLSWATAVGLINGVTADTLCPLEDSTRAQIAVVLQRFYGLFPA